MSEVNDLSKRLADLEAERSELKLQIAARHGEAPRDEVAPTQEPADKRQAELSEQARRRQSAASPTVPAGFNSDEDDATPEAPTDAPRPPAQRASGKTDK